MRIYTGFWDGKSDSRSKNKSINAEKVVPFVISSNSPLLTLFINLICNFFKFNTWSMDQSEHGARVVSNKWKLNHAGKADCIMQHLVRARHESLITLRRALRHAKLMRFFSVTRQRYQTRSYIPYEIYRAAR